MAQEIELKLRLNADDIPTLARWLDTAATSTGMRTLQNDYYDTPSLNLSKAHSALRIRSTVDGFEQTLKARSQSQSAVQVRHEWNWPLSERSLDFSLLALPEVAAHWPAGVSAEDLYPVFSTDFERRSWVLVSDIEGALAKIEIVIDRGEIIAGEKISPLCEVELELMSGDAVALWPVLDQMQSQVPLWLSDVSKAERGYRLAGVPPRELNDTPVTQDGSGLSDQIFELQRALECLVWDQPEAYKNVWRSGYPLWCLLRSAPGDKRAAESLEYLLRISCESPAMLIRADRRAAQALSHVSRYLPGMCTASQPDCTGQAVRWHDARRQVNDVIECSKDNSVISSLIRLLETAL